MKSWLFVVILYSRHKYQFWFSITQKRKVFLISNKLNEELTCTYKSIKNICTIQKIKKKSMKSRCKCYHLVSFAGAFPLYCVLPNENGKYLCLTICLIWRFIVIKKRIKK